MAPFLFLFAGLLTNNIESSPLVSPFGSLSNLGSCLPRKKLAVVNFTSHHSCLQFFNLARSLAGKDRARGPKGAPIPKKRLLYTRCGVFWFYVNLYGSNCLPWAANLSQWRRSNWSLPNLHRRSRYEYFQRTLFDGIRGNPKRSHPC